MGISVGPKLAIDEDDLEDVIVKDSEQDRAMVLAEKIVEKVKGAMKIGVV